MSPLHALRRLLPLPIASYLIGFFAIAGLLYALIGGWMLQQSGEITRLASDQRELAAHRELTTAMNRVESEVISIMLHLLQWEEVYQQLGDPTFYEYWRSNRALQAGYTPHYLLALDLYDKQGRILQQSPDSSLPEQLPAEFHRLRIEEESPYLYHFIQVGKRDNPDLIIGYIGIKVDFQQALLSLNRFVYVDVESIGYIPGGPFNNVTALLTNTRFSPLPIAQTQKMEKLMQDTVIRFAVISLLLLILAYYLTSYLLHTPLRKLSGYIDTLRRGGTPYDRVPVSQAFCVQEFEVLRNSIVSYQLELEQMTSSLDQKNRELWKLAHHDALTAVPNRRAYEEDWKKLQQLIRGQRIALSVILIDCDHFKAINDSYGHDVGDKVLQDVATILQQVLREGDHIYRLGGDEFSVHLLNTEHEEAHQLAIRCLQQLEYHDFKQLGIREPVRFSIGLATATGNDLKSLSQLHKHADIAMYQAKRPGSSKIIHYSPALATAAALTSNRFITAIYRAIETGEGIELNYQPVVSLQDGLQGFHEVLLRLRDDKGQIMPANIFTVIAAEGLAVELDFAIIRHLASQLELQGNGEFGRLSINIDGDTLMHHDFMAQIAALKPYLQKVPQGIVLEITETALISELKEAGNRLQQLRQLGYTVALDDFGSGYSSLRYLASMPVDIIKFDINLVRDLESGTAQAEITADMARMIRRAGYQLVAEGIETEGLLHKVQALGFTHVQGLLYGSPAARPIDIAPLQRELQQAI